MNLPKPERYEFLEHTADIQIRAFGRDLGQLFENAARGMMAYIFGGEPEAAAPTHFESFEIHAPDRESLLVEWLSKLLVLSNTKYAAAVRYTLRFESEVALGAEVGFVPAQAEEDIKAVTYHELEVSQTNGIWQGTVVYDI